MKNNVFSPADILLPDFDRVDGTRYAVVACDQFTSEPEYWKKAEELCQGVPSTLNLILPEAFLAETGERVPLINQTMEQYARDILVEHRESMIYLERVQSDGSVRRGLIGKVDLEAYDYHRGSMSLIRATEGTVLERIPPRVAIRRGAVLELPHVMLLIDDPDRTVIEPVAARATEFAPAYDFDLMLGGGHVRGYYLDSRAMSGVDDALSVLASPEKMEKRYGDGTKAPLLFAVGDGNHSLASAKEAYNEVKAAIGEEAARLSPARYALVEVVNLHDEALRFEPIYRVVFGVQGEEMLASLRTYAARLAGTAEPQKVTYLWQGGEGEICFDSTLR